MQNKSEMFEVDEKARSIYKHFYFVNNLLILRKLSRQAQNTVESHFGHHSAQKITRIKTAS